MAKKDIKTLSASALTQRDAEAYSKALKSFVDTATTSKIKARNTLISLGTHTKSGKLSKRYGG